MGNPLNLLRERSAHALTYNIMNPGRELCFYCIYFYLDN